MRLLPLLPLLILAGCASRQPVTVTTPQGPDVYVTAHDFDRMQHGHEVLRVMDCDEDDEPSLTQAMAGFDSTTGTCYVVVWKPSHRAQYDHDEQVNLACAHALRYQAMYGHRQ